MLDIALEIPLPTLVLGRFLKSDRARRTWVQVLHEAFDRAALAGGIAALTDDDNALACQLDPVLYFEEFYLQLLFVPLIGFATNLGLIRIFSLAKQIPDLLRTVPHFAESMRRQYWCRFLVTHGIFCRCRKSLDSPD